ncbi:MULTISPECIES: bifunctional methylenetetrahydrofolate dehydrogenase/methenyltetrahydrofolate cyclohydrolase FolD [unclassified Methylophilus]|uniref:bifunctional methylenetetrahydrofolate dehydrogenase/methenyltetrahydrofolate cyclohydrolase FolD n=1 Tax=unclassified Methylophilus TaxID=2630143 RepID=UPI0006F74E38|nr:MULTISPECIES: bifunctional methylenetetrahydrofolate dehydrogenase/methenyltetrahydrofolate cyclohydrolase FolD [unclassified Methylophilus]KQT41247.1 bifunctional 5,10-methylene-tetrahydrofolate dehydrogenase/5,10-methylene-tetrahydrofolate cyclohydrolase [Methylophilus sp. Leaf416]KQT57769.1 bifunctional 5,10-methylene-tetrahydrofolate dehydrogenase/5,10-methylene-tetrahydrofolate cyclohydrolase [Methylophilus sp. Leaf459]
MSAHIIDGKQIASQLLDDIKSSIDQRLKSGKRAPCLAVVLVGDDPASAIYVRNKQIACEKVGIVSKAHKLPSSISQTELFSLIQQLNQDPSTDGILVQSPLPHHIDETAILALIDPAKDVDGFHPYNIGLLAVRQPQLRSCTPYGVIKMLQASGINLKGLDAVVVGVSNHVGRPMGLELLLAGCTVTSCHRHTKDLAAHLLRADIVVAAAGKAGLIKGEWIKPGAIVVDIGINRLPDGKLAGDVEFEVAKQRAAYITPVPGGVGPMTVATLMENTLKALELREQK